MAKKTVADLPKDSLRGKRVLVRLDLNVNIDEKTGAITGDRRIRAALPTLQYLIDTGASTIAMTHLGRPKPGADAAKNAPFRMNNVAKRLSEHLKQPVRKLDEVVGESVAKAVAQMKPGDVILLENVRFHPFEQPKKEGSAEEIPKHEAGMKQLAADLARLGDVYVNDAFGTLQNKDVSVLELPKAMKDKPRVIGFLVQKELRKIDEIFAHNPEKLIGIMGGAKVSDKINFIKVLLGKVEKILIGGAMTYTFMLAQGKKIGSSKAEKDKVDLARELLQLAGPKIILPEDHLVADRFDKSANTKIAVGEIPDGWMGLDVGPKTIARYESEIRAAKTIIWNGPMGLYEWDEPFSHGTKAIALAMKAHGDTTIVGGGETADAVEKYNLADSMTHVSTGGGAFLKYVEDRKFKTLDQIEDAGK
ncbi:MAG TPA: phosphoglycerate kinase [Gemmataceae bacterium]|jgi:phosphoglycerate kinase|nr:phosphoglycerate kinase [Gemmataceae bacterium]